MTPRVVSEEEWDRGAPPPAPEYPADACPECHRRPGFHAADCPVLEAARANPPPGPHHPDDLDRDPEGTVARARGFYLRALGKDPLDRSGKVAGLRGGALVVAREAERRRVAADVAATEERWRGIREARHGPAYDVARSIWYGIPMTGAPEVLYPELTDEDALTRGEWVDWAQGHRRAGEDALIDHLASLIPPRGGESYEGWRGRLVRRRASWRDDTDEAVVNRSLYARPRPAGPRSPGTSRPGAARSARKRRAR